MAIGFVTSDENEQVPVQVGMVTSDLSDPPQSFVRSALSEPDGTGSTARLCTFLVVLFALGWVTYLVVRTQGIPDLTNLTVWVVTVTSALYGTNKVTNLLAKKGNSSGS